ncbi:hypothetical protein P171DRAFT_481762 [Karstenula rhodostoma CBS 690.94]|uniref:Uncharacterized protein n=1 Tax=Karstenula rhodostoma CBS 690.94 TaxID=1392251 RepID=A0A9P4PST4_9PLEO|nr:hypothetical protein P171DRAFT_481762 [Karstenula rhodostoma CBS 690.94]
MKFHFIPNININYNCNIIIALILANLESSVVLNFVVVSISYNPYLFLLAPNLNFTTKLHHPYNPTYPNHSPPLSHDTYLTPQAFYQAFPHPWHLLVCLPATTAPRATSTVLSPATCSSYLYNGA